jgi:hypothetical protein
MVGESRSSVGASGSVDRWGLVAERPVPSAVVVVVLAWLAELAG